MISPASGRERTWAAWARGCRPARRDRLLPVDLTQDRPEYGVARRRTVLPVDCPEHALAARLPDQLAQDAIIDLPVPGELVVSRLGELHQTRMTSRLIQDHERRVLEIHGTGVYLRPDRTHSAQIPLANVRVQGRRVSHGIGQDL